MHVELTCSTLTLTDETVQRMLPPISSPHQDMDDSHSASNDNQDPFTQDIHVAAIGRRERRSSASTDPASSSSHRYGNLHLELPKSGSTRSTTTSDVIMTSSSDEPYHGDSYHQQMIADFETMYAEVGGAGDEGEREGDGRRGAVADPGASTSKTVNLSSTHELVSQVSQEEERGAEVATIGGVAFMGEGSGLIDAEEGELSSDSSSEVGGVKRKVQSSPSLPLSPPSLSLPSFYPSLSIFSCRGLRRMRVKWQSSTIS